jgi:hypothetical protein
MSECYTTHMGDSPGLRRSLTAFTPSGAPRVQRRQKAGGCVCNSGNANKLRTAPGFSLRLTELSPSRHPFPPTTAMNLPEAKARPSQQHHALLLPREPQLHTPNRSWQPGRLTGDSPDTRRRLAGAWYVCCQRERCEIFSGGGRVGLRLRG